MNTESEFCLFGVVEGETRSFASQLRSRDMCFGLGFGEDMVDGFLKLFRVLSFLFNIDGGLYLC